MFSPWWLGWVGSLLLTSASLDSCLWVSETLLSVECAPPFQSMALLLFPAGALPCLSAVSKAFSSERLMCLDDLWQWLSGTFEAHPISGFGFSFLVIYGTVDEFSLSADMFHNCQNFDWSGISEKKKNYQRGKKSRLLHHIFTFLCPCPKLLWLEFAAPSCILPAACWPASAISLCCFAYLRLFWTRW